MYQVYQCSCLADGAACGLHRNRPTSLACTFPVWALTLGHAELTDREVATMSGPEHLVFIPESVTPLWIPRAELAALLFGRVAS